MKAVYPDAYIAGCYARYLKDDTFDVVVRATGKTIGSGTSQRKAWADAASRLVPAPEVGEATKVEGETAAMSEPTILTMDDINAQYEAFCKAERAKGILWKEIPSLTEWVLSRLSKAEAALKPSTAAKEEIAVHCNCRPMCSCTASDKPHCHYCKAGM